MVSYHFYYISCRVFEGRACLISEVYIRANPAETTRVEALFARPWWDAGYALHCKQTLVTGKGEMERLCGCLSRIALL
jgi:hypothetical protein